MLNINRGPESSQFLSNSSRTFTRFNMYIYPLPWSCYLKPSLSGSRKAVSV
uniref:Uncharacterized protein n=1 Tax=Arundo donax TaxID=35708 RepID=A0A0A8Y9S7_ARUDO